jgi:hypothetical protein
MRTYGFSLLQVYGESLAERDFGWMCAYCYVFLDRVPKYTTAWNGNKQYVAKPNSATVDHVVPVSLGGPNHIDNFVLCCSRCNIGKRNRLPTTRKVTT